MTLVGHVDEERQVPRRRAAEVDPLRGDEEKVPMRTFLVARVVGDRHVQDRLGRMAVGRDQQHGHIGAHENRHQAGEGNADQPGRAFRTPLATLHAFQGWADLFLATPNAGIDDLFFNVKFGIEKWQLQAIYHDFSSESGSTDYGTEIDLSGSRDQERLNNIQL